MSTDFNVLGHNYESVAVQSEPHHYGHFSPEGQRNFDDLQARMCTQSEDEDARLQMRKWFAVMDCGRSFLFQARRMRDHAAALGQSAPPAGQMISMSGLEALSDFEALLYFGRSTLDRLTFAVAKQTHGQDLEKFDKLSNVLAKFERTDKRARAARTAILASQDHFRGLLTNTKDGKTGLRSLLAHSRSTGESQNSGFSVFRLSNGRVLRLDLDIEGFGVLATSRLLTQHVAFVMLNTVCAYTGVDLRFTLRQLDLSWSANCTHLPPFIDEGDDAETLTLVCPYSCGVVMNNVRVKRALFERATRT